MLIQPIAHSESDEGFTLSNVKFASFKLESCRERREYFSDIYDHLLKLSEMVVSNREVTADIRDSYLSMNSHQTNNVMKTIDDYYFYFCAFNLYGWNLRHEF